MKFKNSFDFIPVSAEFINNHMPKANGAYVKVYLYALYLASRGEEISAAELAKRLTLIESDVINAFNYWNEQGVISYSGETVSFIRRTAAAPKDENSGIIIKKKSIDEISGELHENKALADLCTLAQEILGTTLKNRDIETLYWIYDELGLSPEVITMLLEYCVSKNKRNMNYIEKVAISWHKNGIVTIDAADELISEEKENDGYFYSLKRLFGLKRAFSKSEEEYLRLWRDEYGMDENMVGLAYEYCIIQTTKLSFPYMNSIVKRWNELGIHTVPEAEKDHENFRSKNKQSDFDVYNDKNVDYDEIEKIMRDKM